MSTFDDAAGTSGSRLTLSLSGAGGGGGGGGVIAPVDLAGDITDASDLSVNPMVTFALDLRGHYVVLTPPNADLAFEEDA